MELRNVFGIEEGHGEQQSNNKSLVFVNRLTIFYEIYDFVDRASRYGSGKRQT
jgi:hypothetical protein